MDYRKALKAMQEGAKVKLPEWTGYWFMKEGEIRVLAKNGDLLYPWLDKYNDRTDWEITEGSMGFDFAILALKNGKMVARKGWNGKGMFIFMRPEDTLDAEFIQKVRSLPQPVKNHFKGKVNKIEQTGEEIPVAVRFTPYLCMKAADGTIVNGWLASQTDMLAEDCEVL